MSVPERPDIVNQLDDYGVARTLAAYYPTRIEWVLERLADRRASRGVDNRFDRWRCRLQDRRARKGRHLIAKGRQR